jgi:hypothetical protein
MPEISSITRDPYAQSYPKGSSRTEKKDSEELADPEKKQVKELKERDAEVKSHEMSHIAAGGQCVRGGASFEFQCGPDGKRYAIGGEVSIDTSPVKGDPASTIQKMQTVKRAALAPAKPSGQDRAVAASASAIEAQAKQALSAQKSESLQKDDKKIETGKQYGRNGKAHSIDKNKTSINIEG